MNSNLNITLRGTVTIIPKLETSIIESLNGGPIAIKDPLNFENGYRSIFSIVERTTGVQNITTTNAVVLFPTSPLSYSLQETAPIYSPTENGFRIKQAGLYLISITGGTSLYPNLGTSLANHIEVNCLVNNVKTLSTVQNIVSSAENLFNCRWFEILNVDDLVQMQMRHTSGTVSIGSHPGARRLRFSVALISTF